MVSIVASVILVSLGSKSSVEGLTPIFQAENTQLLNWSIIAALVCGLVLSLQLLTTKMILNKFNFPPNHLNYDTNFGLAVLYLICFLFDKFFYGMEYETMDFFLLTSANLIGQLGMIFLTLAVKYGKGGIVQSIENLKVPMQVVILLVVSGGK